MSESTLTPLRNIPSTLGGSPRTHNMKIIWLGKTDRLELHGYVINSPLTYCSEVDPYEPEASCIVRWLDVGQPIVEEKGALGYWPSYAGMQVHQRANYLTWLAERDRSVIADVGYAFVFFYGLERRALVDKEDLELVFDEVLRMLSSYQSSNSFRGYSVSLLTYLIASKKCPIELTSKLTTEAFRSMLSVRSDLSAVTLAAHAAAGKSLPVEIAMEIADADVRSVRSVVTVRVGKQFEELFAHRYQDKFGEGIILTPTGHQREISYRPASGSLLNKGSIIKPITIPNILADSAQLTELVGLWNECVKELKPLNRVLASGGDIQSRAAYEELPQELRSNFEHPDQVRWNELVAKNAGPDGSVIIEVSKVASLLDIQMRERLTPTQSEEIAAVASDVGFAVEPDARVDGSTYLWQDLIAIFKPRVPGATTSQNYRAAALMLELGSWIAIADETIDDDELEMMIGSIRTLIDLDENDTHRLQMLKAALISKPREPRRLAARIRDALPLEKRTKVGEYLAAVATANGIVDIRERRALRRGFSSLGIDTGLLTTLLPAQDDDELTVVRNATPIVGGETIPSKLSGPVFLVDQAKLRKVFTDTNDVTMILAQVFSESDSVVSQTNVASGSKVGDFATPSQSKRWKGLPAKYNSVFSEIITKKDWTKTEFDAVVRKYNCMTPAVVADINAWSDEYLGDLLIDEQGDFFVNTSLLGNQI